jgi:vancomycin resistance protein VanJ
MFASRVAWTYLLLVAGVWALSEIVGESRWPALLLAYAPPLLWLLPAPLVLLWTLGRRRGFAAALAGTLLATWGAGLLHWRPQTPGPLRLLTYNVARTLPEDAAAEIALTLQAADADLVLLQESNLIRPADLRTLQAALPGYAMIRAKEVTTFSRLPVLSSEWHDLPANNRDVLLTRVRWQGRTLSVINAHLGTVMLSSLLQGDLARLQRSRTARMGQVRVLERIAAQEKGNALLLLAGDLNTPPRGLVYRQLLDTFGPDAHDQAGHGPGWTFPSLKLRIDHALSRDLSATRAAVLNVPGSDHRPLLVEYR